MHTPTPTINMLNARATTGMQPLTTTFTPDPACATPVLHSCYAPQLNSNPPLGCSALAYAETRCSSKYSCYPPDDGLFDRKTYSPAFICPLGWETAGYRRAVGTTAGGVICCPTSYTLTSGGWFFCQTTLTQGPFANVLALTNTETCKPVATTLEFGPEEMATVEWFGSYDRTTTAVGYLTVMASASLILLKDHTLTGTFTDLLSTTASSKTTSWQDLYTPITIPNSPPNYIGGSGSFGSSSSATTREYENSLRIRLGLSIALPIFFMIIITAVTCWWRRRRAKKRQAGASQVAQVQATDSDGTFNNSNLPPMYAAGPVAGTEKSEQQYQTAYQEMDHGTAIMPELTGHHALNSGPRSHNSNSLQEMDHGTPLTPELHSSQAVSAGTDSNGADRRAELDATHGVNSTSPIHEVAGDLGSRRSELSGDSVAQVPMSNNMQTENAQKHREVYLRQQLDSIRAQEQRLADELKELGNK